MYSESRIFYFGWEDIEAESKEIASGGNPKDVKTAIASSEWFPD